MPQAKNIVTPTPYASGNDFCRIFEEDMNGLYLLSFLLTADRQKAEECFVSGLEDSVEGNPVFKEWARSWARRAIIRNAVRVIELRPGGRGARSTAAPAYSGDSLGEMGQEQIAAVLALEPFERFVYVMSVLEHYSDQDCSVLLSCTRRDILAARDRALLQIGSAMAPAYGQLQPAGSEKPASSEPCSSVLQLLATPSLATS